MTEVIGVYSHVHPEDQAVLKSFVRGVKEGKATSCGKKSVLAERTGNIHGPVSMLWSEIIVRRKAYRNAVYQL